MNRVLFIRLSALGDVLHTLPALAAVKRARPEIEIDWLVEEGGAPLLQGHPMIRRVFVVPRKKFKQDRWGTLRGDFRELTRELRAQRYDATVDFQGLTKSAIWGRAARARKRIGFRGEDSRELSSLLYNKRITPGAEREHVIQKNLALLQGLGIETDKVEFPVVLQQEVRARALEIWQYEESLSVTGQVYPRVVMNPGAGWITKQWPAERYGKLARQLADKKSARVAIAWGPGEEPLVAKLMEAASAGRNWEPNPKSIIEDSPGVYALPPTSFVELGGILERADLMVAGDTGPIHFASALGVPVVSIFGASDPDRNGPWDTSGRTQIIQNDSPECIPCWKTRCTWREPLACLERIEVDRVFVECLTALGGAQA